MATKKGIVITVIILGAIAAGSSVTWLLPQNRGPSIVISDYGNELEGVKEKHALIMTEMNANLKSMLNKTLSPGDYTTMAQTSSAQTTSLISELIESNPPTEWKLSYLNYAEALKKYNDYLTESIALASKMKSGISANDMSDETSKLDSLMNDTNSFIAKSNETKP